jgi:ferredoxin-NADP reductase/ferredoxin
MKRDIAEQLEGYQDVLQLVHAAEALGEDFRSEKGAVAAYLQRLHPPRLSLRVSHIQTETPSTKTFRMVSAEGVLPPFQAGQYVALHVDVEGIRTNRPLSIASPPNQTGYYDLTVKRVPGGLVSNYLLDTLQVGARLTSSAPDGGFVYNPLLHGQRLLFIAGGSGITPFMSMLRDVSDRGLERHITLIYGNRTEDDIIYHEELTTLAARLTHFTYVPVVEQPGPGYAGEKGFMSGDLIERVAGDLGGAMFYLCGPSGMYDFCLGELRARNVPARRIRREMFGPPVHVSECPGWPSTIGENDHFAVSIVDGPTIEARAGAPLLNTFEQAGLAPPSQCRSGECSLCRVRILKGRVFQPAGVPLRQADRQQGYVHCCVSYPLEDLEILVEAKG